MAKYIIEMEKSPRGIQYLDALDFRFYFFLAEEFIPNDEAKTHIDENYNNKITDYIRFGYERLATKRGVIIEGWALSRKGPLHTNYMSQNWDFDKLRELSEEINQSIREYETVIILNMKTGQHPSNCNAGWNYESSGYFSVDLNYDIKRRSEKIKKSGYRDDQKYDYFKIPKDEDVETYIPKITDADYNPSGGTKVIPYSKSRYATIQSICATGKRVGDELRDLLENKELELPDNKNIFMIDYNPLNQ